MPGSIRSSTTRSGRCSRVQLDRLRAVGGHEDAVALALQPGPDGLGDRLLVVDDEHGLFAHGAIVPAACVPPPGAGVENLWRRRSGRVRV